MPSATTQRSLHPEESEHSAALRQSAEDRGLGSRLSCWMEDHFRWMLIAGYSSDTVRTRRIAIKRFIRWVGALDLNDPRQLRRSTLLDYQRELFQHRKRDGRPMSVGSQIGYLAPLKTWFKWLAREHLIRRDPATALHLPKTPRRLPRALLSVRDVDEANPKS